MHKDIIIVKSIKSIISLINNSIDHWRARWYDKFQYFMQGIFY